MLHIADILIFILFFLNIVFLFLGYLIGKTNKYNIYSISEKAKEGQAQIGVPVNIDDTKIITKIKTDGLEKKYNNLGEIKNSQENITDSINKLKNMKG